MFDGRIARDRRRNIRSSSQNRERIMDKIQRHEGASKFLVPLALLAIVALILVLRPWVVPSAQSPSLQHPLDPLTREEIESAVAVIKASGKLTSDVRFATIYLKEPSKGQVVADISARRSTRAAFALLYNWSTRVTSEVVVDLNKRSLVSWKDWDPNEPP